MSHRCDCGRLALSKGSVVGKYGRRPKTYIYRKHHNTCPRCYAASVQQAMALRLAQVRSELQQEIR